ncbi:sugar-binding domain-containing protein [Paenibacillus sp.]|uniref:glycoside hydrolase family 2 protein n=1 Tax=Paenibacillus sp. TaxID=58172 RepID=UPI002810DA4F|nr:sugar-binding domain-containing protein [Paenibacillus sp.]
MSTLSYYRPVDGKRYLDEVQDEAYASSSLHGDALIEAESRIPRRPAIVEPASGAMPTHRAERLCLSGAWRMIDCDPADPGDPAPNTGWFGRRAKASPGMIEKWYAPGFDRSAWHEVRVPTTVQKALVDLGLLDDPLWNANTIDELESHGEPKERPLWFRRTRVERRDWWFAKTFEAPSAWQGKRLTLRFDGLDYSGTVFFNGASLGHHKGMFGGPDLDVTGLVRYDAPNELVVRIDQAPETWNGLLKGSPGFGWHYGHLISMGIWRDVWVQAEPDVAIVDPYVATTSIEGGAAKLRIAFAAVSRSADRATVVVEGDIRRKGVPADAAPALRFRSRVEASYGRNEFEAEVELPEPALWWPVGYGDPALYTLTLAGRAADDAAEAIDAIAVDFGVRTIELRPFEDTAPETEYRWQFVVNGVPIFVKGANWCWPDPMLEQNEALYERLLELARRGNVQMLRAWGGGLVEGDFFYRMCDEKGIMVYQEFPLCWGPPDSPHTDLGVVDRQVTRSVKRLRSHPSLVMWGGGNENGPHGGADEGLFLVGRRCRQFDPSRPYHRTDPWGGSAHNWHVYHFGEPMDAATLAMPSVMYGEYGIPSMPNRDSCLRYVPEEAMASWPPTEDSRGLLAHSHQFSLKDVIKVMRYGAYGPIRDWDDYIAYSQTAQGETLRFTAEIQRAGAGATKSGFWYYKFTDLFPGHSWGIIDYYGTPKLSYYRAMQACRPRSAFATYEKMNGWSAGETFEAGVHAANETRESLDGASVSATLYGSDLTELRSNRYEGLTLAPNAVALIDRIAVTLPGDERIRPFLLAVALRAADGSLVADQWYWFNAQAKTEELLAFERRHTGNSENEYPGEQAAEAFALYASLPDAPMRRLPETRLEWSLGRGAAGTAGEIRVRNVGAVPAVRVTIQGFPDDDWGSYLGDNDFGLYPGEARAIPFATSRECPLDGISVGAWNAPRI